MEWKETTLKIGEKEFKTIAVNYDDLEEWRNATNPDASISLTDEHYRHLPDDLDKEALPIVITCKNKHE